MKLAIVFPNENSFYRKIGMEVYENFQEMKKVFSECKKYTGLNIADILYYENSRYQDESLFKRIALMAVQVGYYQVLKSIYEIEPELFIGQGTGYISALVGANAISLKTAIQVLKGRRVNKMFLSGSDYDILPIPGTEPVRLKDDIYEELYKCPERSFDNDEYIKYIEKYKINVCLEIGPDNIFSQKQNYKDNEIIYSYLDTKINNNYILDNLVEKKFNSTIFAVRRILGIFASTQNLNRSDESYDEVIKAFAYVKSAIDNYYMRQKSGDASITEEEFNNCIKCLRTNFIYKNTPKEEIRERIRLLEIETLLHFNPYFADMYND